MTQRRRSPNCEDGHVSKRLKISDGAQANELDVPGKIKKIVLKNFMCHEHLGFEFENNINIISGKNGSGKSAILAAVVIGLGGRSSDTNRGSSVKNLIRNGQQRAAIEVTLNNRGDLAYKNEIYGDEITIVRTITMSTSSYKIIDANGKTLPCKRDDIRNILFWFNIQIDNPVAILNQDTARNFLKSADPKALYHFFMKGTLLEDIYHQHTNLVKERLPSIQKTLEAKNEELKHSSKDIVDMQMKVKKLEELHSYEDELTKVQNELYWATVYDLEKKLEVEYKSLKESEEKLPPLIDKIGKRESLEAELKNKQRMLEEKIEEIKGQNDAQEIEIHSAEQKYLAAKEVYNKKLLEVKRLQKKINNDEKNCLEIENEVEKLKSRSAEMEARQKKRLQEKSDFQGRLSELKAVKQTTEVHRQQLSDTSVNFTNNCVTKEQYLKNMKEKVRFKERRLLTLKEEKSELSIYSDWMPRLVAAINTAAKNKMFRKTPLGPLGFYLKLKEESWGPAVESFIGFKVLCSFCIDNSQDLSVFNKIVRSLNIPEKERPSAAVSRFINRVHDISKHGVNHSKYRTLLDSFTISEPVIANSLIDQLSPENIVLIPTSEEAYELLSVTENVPRNCKRGLTKKGDVFYPRPNYRSYAGHAFGKTKFLQLNKSQAIRAAQEDLESAQKELQAAQSYYEEAKEQAAGAQAKVKDVDIELAQINKQIRTCELRLAQLDNQDDFSSANFNVLVEDLEYRRNLLTTTQDSLQKEEKESESLQLSCVQLKKHLKEIEKSKINFAEQLAGMREELSTVKSEFQKITVNWNHFKQLVVKEEAIVQQKKDNISKTEKQLCDARANAEKACEPVKTDRSIKSIETKIMEVTSSIKTIESLIGGSAIELSADYHRRMSKFVQTLNTIKSMDDSNKKLKSFLDKMLMDYEELRKIICINIKQTFRAMLNVRNYSGEINIDHDKKILTISVKADEAAKKASRTDSLSGGERSFSMVSFIMALWNNMNLPFYFLDEFDVFMDSMNRKTVLTLLLEHAKGRPQQQYVFLTPHDTGVPINAAVFRMVDPRP